MNENKSNALIPPSALNTIAVKQPNRQMTRVFCWAVTVRNKGRTLGFVEY